ncbi:DUF6903 family protein [uncultured Pseudoflavonifractor sp.]|uniref:DUF6903 family protein n=1 Tax=uncultured Pseudoflavonifractor sp. TaxID=1221379 RepID=UPI0025EC0EF6|nr:hypothetical protein [uncultured Pseudoflavonifractor sp.]
MKFWKEHMPLRVSLIAIFTVVGLILVVAGWKMTGELAGLGIMLVGLVLLLTALLLYNKPFEEAKDKTKKPK